MPPAPGDHPTREADRPAAAAVLPGPATAPVLAIITGHPSAEQAAAVLAVLAARMAPGAAPPARPQPRSQWSARRRLLREPLPAGWDASTRPR